jgi:Reverse transcriptase (RNA-dependent DNA polymerase)
MIHTPSYFQCTLDHVLQEKNNTNMFVYMDDILIATETRLEHAKTLESVFKKFTEFGLRGKFEKCEFYQNSILFLGNELSEKGIRFPSERLEGLNDMTPSGNICKIQRLV